MFHRLTEKSFSKTRWLSSDSYELCDKIKVLLKEKQAGGNSNTINKEIVAIVGKLLGYKCISSEARKFLLHKCLRLLKSPGARVSASGVPSSQKKLYQKQDGCHLILMNFVIDLKRNYKKNKVEVIPYI